MLSRRAKLIYWMSRYLERSNFTSRLLITTSELQLDLSLDDEISWKPLLTVTNLNKDYLDCNNAILLPHLGSATNETREAMGFRVIKNLNEFFSGKVPEDKIS